MAKWNAHTIGNFFIYFVIAFVFLPSMMMATVAFYEFKSTKQEKVNHLQDIITMQREVIEGWITTQSSQVRGIAALDFVRQSDLEKINQNFTTILKHQEDFSTIAYVNKEGIIQAADQPASIINNDITTRSYFQEAMQGKNYISDILISRGTNQPMIVFASPVYASTGEIQGVVYGVVRLTRINTLMTKSKFGQTGKLYLVTYEGKVIAGIGDGVGAQVNMIKDKFNKYSVAQALEYKSGNSIYENSNGKKVLGTYQQIDNTQWAIIGEIDESEILKPFYRHLEIIATIYAVALLLIIPIITFFYKKNIMPLQSLVYGLKAIEMGNYSHQIPKSIIAKAPKELKQLCEKFSQMSITIKNNIELLHVANETLAEAEIKYRSLVENALVGVYIIQDEICTYVNPNFASIFGYTQPELVGVVKIQELISPTDWPKVSKNMQLRLTGKTKSVGYELKGIKKSGKIIDLVTYGSVCNLQGKPAIIGTIIDISDRKSMEEKLRYLSFHDQLTGLYNRNYFEEVAIHSIALNQESLGIIVCDVDGLKLVNDILGHQHGDKILREAAGVLKQCFTNNEMIARIGGDEFVILLPSISHQEIEEVQQKLYDQVHKVNSGNTGTKLSMSVGIAVNTVYPIDVMKLFNEADTNMYYEKRKRCNRKKI